MPELLVLSLGSWLQNGSEEEAFECVSVQVVLNQLSLCMLNVFIIYLRDGLQKLYRHLSEHMHSSSPAIPPAFPFSLLLP